MSIIKVIKQQGRFLVADVEVFEDTSLSFGARGLMAYLLTKPEGWEIRRDHLMRSSPAGKVALQRMINELKAAGYMRRYQQNDATTGKFVTYTDVYEKKSLNPEWRNNGIDDADIMPISATPTPTSGGPSATVTTKPVHGANGSFRHLELDPAALPTGAYVPPEPEKINSMISVLSGTCKGFANFLKGDQCQFYQTAVRLIEYGYAEENVMAFREWWTQNGYYEGQPSLTTLEQEIDNAIKGVKRGKGSTKEIVQAINELDLFLARKLEFDAFSSKHTKAAIRKVGLGTIRSIGPSNRKSILRQFEDEYNRSRSNQ